MEALRQYQKDVEKYVSPENCVGKTVEVGFDKTPSNGYKIRTENTLFLVQ